MLIVYIRPIEQRERDGELPGAIVIDRNVLERRLDPSCEHHISKISTYDARIVIVCNEGYSSSLVAALLHDLGQPRNRPHRRLPSLALTANLTSHGGGHRRSAARATRTVGAPKFAR